MITRNEPCVECGQPEFHKNHFAFVNNTPVSGGHAYEAPAPSPAQGTPEPPKVEEIAGIIYKHTNANWCAVCESTSSDCYCSPTLGHRVSLDAAEEILRLRPYFPPASQTPKSVIEAATELLDAMETCHVCKGTLILKEHPVHCEDCPSDCENHEGSECTPIYDLHAKLRKLLKLATPASTARTDGWVDAKVRLPKAPETNDDPEFVYVKWTEAARWSGDEDEDNPRSASGYDTCLIAYLLENPKLISHWRELPAAPGSVPHKANLLDEDKSLRPTSKGFVGVPQAEPPSTFFCENCKLDKPLNEQYSDCADSTICNLCAEGQISGKSL